MKIIAYKYYHKNKTKERKVQWANTQAKKLSLLGTDHLCHVLIENAQWSPKSYNKYSFTTLPIVGSGN